MHSSDKEAIRQEIIAAGACRAGFATACKIDETEDARYNRWIDCGKHGEMRYLERYGEIRRDPRLLLDGAKTVISCAFDYRQPTSHPLFADYAIGADYHEVLRDRLSEAAEHMRSRYGGDTRVCVDTAPIHERYWAAKSGIGFIGLNGQLIVEGIGTKVMLGEILWTIDVEPDRPLTDKKCIGCGACAKACPGGALDGKGGLDARRCLSYLGIEYRGDLPEDLRFHGRIYGCDVCQDVCPYNKPTDKVAIEEFTPRQELMDLDIEKVRGLDDERFRSLFRHSAVKRAKLSGLLRNASRHDDDHDR